MRKILTNFITIFIVAILVACGNTETKNDSEELPSFDVDFIVPESVEAGETVELKAVVTYGDEAEKDAVVKFEVWETGDQDNSVTIEADNNGDGTYTTTYTFEHDGNFEMYAHTDAQNLHTMPKKEVTVGEGGHRHHDESEHDHGFHTEGFDLHFMKPENVAVGEETELITHLMMHEDALEEARVRYEIWIDGQDESVDWVEAEEGTAGEYTAQHIFEEEGTYNIQIHVEDNEDLHEHVQYELEVN